MPGKNVHLLHVEDDQLQRRLIAHHLERMEDYRFEISYASSEEQALEQFQPGLTAVVLLDYHLSEGNGLNVLRKLRERDPVVPVVALSGVATEAVAAELLTAGADDYLSKKDLTSQVLNQCLSEAMRRAEAWRRHTQANRSVHEAKLSELFGKLFHSFSDAAGNDFFERLEQFEQEARKAQLSPAQVRHLFETACEHLSRNQSQAGPAPRQLMRPIALELLLRLYGDFSDTHLIRHAAPACRESGTYLTEE